MDVYNRLVEHSESLKTSPDHYHLWTKIIKTQISFQGDKFIIFLFFSFFHSFFFLVFVLFVVKLLLLLFIIFWDPQKTFRAYFYKGNKTFVHTWLNYQVCWAQKEHFWGVDSTLVPLWICFLDHPCSKVSQIGSMGEDYPFLKHEINISPTSFFIY